MTQDAQKFTKEDLKKADEIHEKAMTARQCRELTAQALRDERKGLEDRVRELEKRSREDGLLGQASLDEANNRVKTLEAENEALKKDIDVMASGMARYVEENARLKAEAERLKLAVNSWMSSSTRWCEKNDASEVRLEEAVRVLAWYAMIDGTARLRPEGKKPQITIDASLAKTFLRSCLDENPTPQEPVYIKEHKEVLPFMKNIKAGDLDPEARCIQWSCRCGYQNFNQVCNKCNSLKADSEARGGCEHDKGTYWVNQKPSTWVYEKSEYPKCPTCDKKTGGV